MRASVGAEGGKRPVPSFPPFFLAPGRDPVHRKDLPTSHTPPAAEKGAPRSAQPADQGDPGSSGRRSSATGRGAARKAQGRGGGQGGGRPGGRGHRAPGERCGLGRPNPLPRARRAGSGAGRRRGLKYDNQNSCAARPAANGRAARLTSPRTASDQWRWS